jgi:ABC-type polysaccharide/polyol phosphate transport system ATPase subunit
MSDAIVIDGLSKRYLLGEEFDALDSLRELVLHLGRGRRRTAAERRGEVWALRDLDLTVREGEVLGIIGRNGSGKSTLLKILARITDPTEGVARVRGRVGALLEVGTAFDPELTGRENILINGALLGMRRRDVLRHFDDIVEFAGVERFLDTPVKRFSSGMYLRLGFAVAAHLEPEILVVDEVLAVGDAEFQRRCLERISVLGSEGRTILYVSHDLGSLSALCDRCTWLDGGRVRADGVPGDVIATYLRDGIPPPAVLRQTQSGRARLTGIRLVGEQIEHGMPLAFELDLENERRMSSLDVCVWIVDEIGRRVVDEALLDDAGRRGVIDAPGAHHVSFGLPPTLAPGTYVAGVWLGDEAEGTIFNGEVLRFEVVVAPGDPPDARSRSRLVSPPVEWAWQSRDR